MKIKCPAGCGEFDSTLINAVQSELSIHIDNEHENSTDMLCDLLIKIHEKIEFHEQEAFEEHFGIDVAKELKSLLENDKK